MTEIEIKEEDIRISCYSPKTDSYWINTPKCMSKEHAEQLKQQILRDHKLAVEVRNATKMAHSLGQAGIEDDIKNRQIVKRLEVFYQVMLGWTSDKETEFFVRRVKEILENHE